VQFWGASVRTPPVLWSLPVVDGLRASFSRSRLISGVGRDFGKMIMELPRAGGCLCGAIRYQISAEPRSADYCHCSMCRRAAGAPVVARLTVANESFRLDRGRARGPSLVRNSRALVLSDVRHPTRPARRTRLPRRDACIPHTPEAVRPSYLIWTASQISWFEIADDLPRYQESSRAEV
jgi:hypothetical protein